MSTTIGHKDRKGNLLILGGWQHSLWQLKNGLYDVNSEVTASPEVAVESYNRVNSTNLQPDYIEKWFSPWYDSRTKYIDVPSRTSNRTYQVKVTPDGEITCDPKCKGFKYYGDCWHVQAVKELTSG